VQLYSLGQDSITLVSETVFYSFAVRMLPKDVYIDDDDDNSGGIE